jgi:hypothetical protein
VFDKISREITNIGAYGTVKDITVNEDYWSPDIERLQGDFKVSKGKLGVFKCIISYVAHKGPEITRRLFI